MTAGIPDAIQQALSSFFRNVKHQTVHLSGFTPASGGCINHGGKVSTTAGEFFLKWNNAGSFPGMFEAEKKGLQILRQPKVIDVPLPIGSGEAEGYQWIVMEYKRPGRRAQTFWEELGNSLALLHRETQNEFGLDHDNYIGSLQQNNTTAGSWIEFFIARRLLPQVKMAVDNGQIDAGLAATFGRLYARLPALLPEEKPALIHGDLWSGNLMVNADGDPCLIDPAVYYGHREIEIAFTTLFGGMDATFYAAYDNAFSMTPGFSERRDIYNLYPLMVHVNLFGGGYASQAKSILKNLKV